NPGPQRSRISAATRARWLTISWLFRILSTPPGCWTSRIFPLAILTPNEFCRDQLPLHAKPHTVRIVLTGNIIPIDLEARPIVDDEVVGIEDRKSTRLNSSHV